MAEHKLALFMGIFGGENRQNVQNLRQDSKLLELSQALNVVPDPLGAVATRDGFTHVRAAAISGDGAITGMSHDLRAVADKFVFTDDDGDVFEDSANPPVAKSGGTDFTDGADNLTRFDVHESLLIITSRLRDIPQTVNASGTRADLGGTPPRGLDYKVFGRRGFMISPSDGTTIHYEKASYNSANDDHDAWDNPYTINFLNFGRQGSGEQAIGAEVYADHLMCYTLNGVFPVYTTPNATAPFAFQKNIFPEKGGGPVGAHAIVSGGGKVFWVSENFDIKRQTGFEVKSIGYAAQPFLRGLSDSRRAFIVGGYEPKYRMVLWACSDGSDTAHQDVLGLQIDTEQFYFFTLSVNAMASRVVSGEQRLIGGHYNGLFSNLFDGSTTGDLQTAASAIDADTITAKLHHGLPGIYKKIPYFCVFFDPIGSEVVTVQYRLDDETSWTTPSGSPITMSGTDIAEQFFEIERPYKTIQIRIRDNNSGERYRATMLGFPDPISTFMSL